jgi:hypothetical protein
MISTEKVADGPFPLVVGIQGGGVEPKAYRWLYRHIASRGFVVLTPSQPGDLPIFATGNASGVVRALRRWSRQTSGPLSGTIDNQLAAILGHSLGGVVAAKNWLYEPESFSELVLLASYPVESEDYRRRSSPKGDTVLSIIGGRDERRNNVVENAYDGVERIREPSTFAVIEGMNHYQSGNVPSRSQLARDAAPSVDTDDTRHRALSMIDAFLERFAGRSEQLLDRPEDWLQGVLTWEEWRGKGGMTMTRNRDPGLGLVVVGFLGLLALPQPVVGEGLEGTGASPVVAAAADPTGAGVGIQWPSGTVHLAASLEFDHRLLWIAPRLGVR